MTDQRLELLQQIEDKAYIERQDSDKGQPLKIVKEVADFLETFDNTIKELDKDKTDVVVIFGERGIAYVYPLVGFDTINISKLHKLQEGRIGEFLIDQFYNGEPDKNGQEAKEEYLTDLSYQIDVRNSQKY